ncbi:MAG: tetraacyldisaccharide 4'-kinase [Planctomycetes bacterium]|nr:tetraacyldisaccharide 4'-kinase [Planctomycetota bacterium]MCH9725930.1 tetraacyldisaccharide 4'-kinase [Planctomycetota bacterium]MCH9777083.1 tetraacyldisaccharide 4'-kinase [Planctomycetota bacterium]MCH9793288.1 tetraacyldisaccharide 4'-kinase [Planctomycetota bacterium]MDF1744448.1 tetraacyldisaccharide 4'-kinase [Gimesia sp.]
MNEVEYLRIISGQRQDWRARLLKVCLGISCFPYRVAVALRNRMFDWRLRSTHQSAVPVISLGNLTTGGTGKTPFVAYLTRWFQEQGVNVALLSRGYRALPGEVNDEKLLLDRLCRGVPHYQNPNRSASAEQAVAEGAQLLILDDGFQHRKLVRNLDIVLIDALNPWGYGSLLPRGLLREPKSALRRADFVILTRADQCSQTTLENLQAEIANELSQDLIGQAVFRPLGLVNADGQTQTLESVAGKTVWAFCAIGNPLGFRQTLENAGYRVAGMQIFPDHHHYSSEELQEIGSQAALASADLILTTSKDLVKLSEQKLSKVPVWAVEIGAEMTQGNEAFEGLLHSLILEVSSG